MKKTTLVMTVSVLTILMVLPVIGSVNTLAGKPTMIDRTLRADGAPLPPPIPPQSSLMDAETLVADGAPLPPPIPPQSSLMDAKTLVADGAPLPPPIPPQSSLMDAKTLVADGAPLLPPRPSVELSV